MLIGEGLWREGTLRSLGDLFFQGALVALYGGRLGETRSQKMARAAKIAVVLMLLSSAAFAAYLNWPGRQRMAEPEYRPPEPEKRPYLSDF